MPGVKRQAGTTSGDTMQAREQAQEQASTQGLASAQEQDSILAM